MDLIDAIDTYNRSGQPKIELQPLPDGRVLARLPRLRREILVRGGAGPSAHDLAAVCEEAQLAITPGMTLLEAGLAAIGSLARGADENG